MSSPPRLIEHPLRARAFARQIEARNVRRDEVRALVRERLQRTTGRRERDRVQRVGVHDRVDLWASRHDFGVDRILDMATSLPLENLTVP